MEKIKYVPSDVLVGMFFYFYLGMPESPHFINDFAEIHKRVFEIRKEILIFKFFPFSKGGVFPFSRTLAGSFNKLLLSGVVVEDLEDDKFTIQKAPLYQIKVLTERMFGEDEREQLKKAALLFWLKCRCKK